jgi:hypothetical protein
MGQTIVRFVAKTGKDKKLTTKYESLMAIPAEDIDGI